MSSWGPWLCEETGLVHVVPCDDDLKPIGGHQRSVVCWCRPKPDADLAQLILHHDPHRGGTRTGTGLDG